MARTTPEPLAATGNFAAALEQVRQGRSTPNATPTATPHAPADALPVRAPQAVRSPQSDAAPDSPARHLVGPSKMGVRPLATSRPAAAPVNPHAGPHAQLDAQTTSPDAASAEGDSLARMLKWSSKAAETEAPVENAATAEPALTQDAALSSAASFGPGPGPGATAARAEAHGLRATGERSAAAGGDGSFVQASSGHPLSPSAPTSAPAGQASASPSVFNGALAPGAAPPVSQGATPDRDAVGGPQAGERPSTPDTAPMAAPPTAPPTSALLGGEATTTLRGAGAEATPPASTAAHREAASGVPTPLVSTLALHTPPPSLAMPVSPPLPLNQPAFASELGVQVALWTRQGVQQAELHLNPAELGPVQVSIQLDGAQAQVRFVAEAAATRDALQAALPELAQALAQDGLTLGSADVQSQSQQPDRQPTASGMLNDGNRRARYAGHEGDAPDADAFPPDSPATRVSTRRGLLDLYA